MGRIKLPDGVLADNQHLAVSGNRAVSGKTSFIAPDTAIPQFGGAYSRVVVEVDDDDDDKNKDGHANKDEDGHYDLSKKSIIILIVIAMMLSLLAVFVAMSNKPVSMADCASQPEWNQYNCNAR